MTIDPVTGLKTTATFKANTSDIVHKFDPFNFTDAHSSSLADPGTDITSGKNTLTGDETTDENVTNDVHIVGSLAPGETVDAENKFQIADNSNDTFSDVNILTTDGTDTVTNTFVGKYKITFFNVNHSISETKVDPATGNSTTISVVDWLGGNADIAELDTDTKVMLLSGTPTDTPSIGNSGTFEQDWSLFETVTQKDSGGNVISPTVTTTDAGSDIETLLNDVMTDPGGTNTHTDNPASANPSPAASGVPAPAGNGNSQLPPEVVKALKETVKELEAGIQKAKELHNELEAKMTSIQDGMTHAKNPAAGYIDAQRNLMGALVIWDQRTVNVESELKSQLNAAQEKLNNGKRPKVAGDPLAPIGDVNDRLSAGSMPSMTITKATVEELVPIAQAVVMIGEIIVELQPSPTGGGGKIAGGAASSSKAKGGAKAFADAEAKAAAASKAASEAKAAAAGAKAAGAPNKEARGGTYKLKDEAGDVKRTGQSNDLNRREGEHGSQPETKDLKFVVDKRSDDYAARRGREEIIHGQHPEALKENGGLNKQRAIDPKNKRIEEYRKKGKEL